jgi:hypothetical protein
MRIPVPLWLDRVLSRFGDWANVPLTTYTNIRRIDVFLTAAGFFCVAYYGLTAGPLAALQGGLMYVFVLMIALMFRPEN